MTRRSELERGRGAFERREWGSALSAFAEADRKTPLEAADLERLAMSARLAGRDGEADAALTRAHEAHLEGGDLERGARCAFWLALALFERGEQARGGGWLERARRLLDDGERDCAESGYLLIPAARQAAGRGDGATSQALFRQAAAFGERHGDRDLVTLARHGEGRSLILQGEVARGIALLDEVMVGVAAGEASPLVIGIVYCSVISACRDVFDLRRASEWTEALNDWCASQADLVPFRGECLVRRAEIMQLHGDWRSAMEEARRACEWNAHPGHRGAQGEACYQLAEVHRLRGAFAEAEEAYRRAGRLGRGPHPGLALLRLAQGRMEDAAAAMRRLLDEARHPRVRSRVLAPYVEILLAAGDAAGARAGADELAEIARRLDAPLLHALSAQAEGAVLLAEDEARSALASLRRAAALWREIGAPYETARVSVLLAQACSALGDHDTAQLELEGARDAFTRLGAAPDLARIETISPAAPSRRPDGLTTRELQVLRLVATGRTNRIIARELGISEKTVARHVSNIFTKLDLSSRAAATAYAYEHDLA